MHCWIIITHFDSMWMTCFRGWNEPPRLRGPALVILFLLLGIPLSWHRAALMLVWIGWSTDVTSWTVQESIQDSQPGEGRVQWQESALRGPPIIGRTSSLVDYSIAPFAPAAHSIVQVICRQSLANLVVFGWALQILTLHFVLWKRTPCVP